MTKSITSSDAESVSNATSSTSRSTFRRHHHRRRRHDNHDHLQQTFIPGLPNHISQLCLCLVHPSVLYSVCRSWRRLIYSPSFPPFLSIYSLLLSTNADDHVDYSNSFQISSFDPISSRWQSLPPSPQLDPPLRFLFRHPSFISRFLPIQSVSVAGKLVLLAATDESFLPALPRPFVFNPLTRNWTLGPPFNAPRRWCTAGSWRGTVYAASGIGSRYSRDVARSVEKWDLKGFSGSKRNRSFAKGWKWKKVRKLKDGKFSRDAIDAIGVRGKLYMVNVEGNAHKEGMVYDVENDSWDEMPQGMLGGWKGPAAAMEEETMFMVDESNGVLRKYDPERDDWMDVLESEKLIGAEHIAAAGGRVCVVCGGGLEILVVDVVLSPPRLWVVDTPSGFHSLAVHILPRMSQSDF